MPVLEPGAGCIQATTQQVPTGFAFHTRQHDQTGMRLAQPRRIDEREIPVTSLRPGARNKPRKIAISLVVLAQQGKAEWPMTIAGILQPYIAASNRLDARLLGCRMKLDQGKQVDLIGERNRRHAGCRTRRNQRIDADGRINQRILAVDMQMDESRGHGAIGRGDQTG